jgi:hypothetical protein
LRDEAKKIIWQEETLSMDERYVKMKREEKKRRFEKKIEKIRAGRQRRRRGRGYRVASSQYDADDG